MITRRFGFMRSATAIIALACAAGCAQSKSPVPIQYGASHGKSINGIRSFVDVLKAQDHRVTVTQMVSDRQTAEMDVLIRFAQRPGPPDAEETDVYHEWLRVNPNRLLIYVLPGYRSEHEYWQSVKARLGPDDPPDAASRIDRAMSEGEPTISSPPATGPAGHIGTPLFEMVPIPGTVAGPPAPQKGLFKPPPLPPPAAPPKPPGPPGPPRWSGEWATGVDPVKADLPLAPDFRLKAVKKPEILLKVNGSNFAASGQTRWLGEPDGGRILVINNAAFLTNGGLLNRERRKLTARLLDAIAPERASRNILVIEGAYPARWGDRPWAFQALTTPPLNRIMPHWLILGLLACWSRALRLGRPRDEIQKRDDRVEANPEAVGDLLAHTQNEQAAQDLLKTYYDWRKSPVRHRQRPR